MKKFALLFCLLLPMGLRAADRPNFIFFLSDDHRWDRLGCAGHPMLKTPVIDKLAAKGVRFRNMFVTTSICAASRASLFTGCYERTHGYTFGTGPIHAELVQAAYPARFKAAGYRTGFVGKFGVRIQGQPAEDWFDVYKPLHRNPYHKKQPDGSTRHVSELAGDEAIRFLENHAADQPFCLSVSFNAAHAEDGDKRPGIGHFPWPKAVDGLYDDVPITAPRLSDASIFEAHPEFLKKSINRERFFWRWDTPEKYAINLRAYYRMITGLDRVMGRVLTALDEKGLADNTVIVFSGDNGYYEGQRGFAGKWSHYEESLRVPLVIYDPRAPKNQRGKLSDPMVLNIDVAPTMLDLAGLSVPKEMQGRSLRPLLQGITPKDWRQDTFCEHLMNHGGIPKWEGVRGDGFIYARYFQQKPVYEYLHDLKSDPDQLKNFADDPAYAEKLGAMRTRCDTLRDQLGGKYSQEKVDAWKKEARRKK